MFVTLGSTQQSWCSKSVDLNTLSQQFVRSAKIDKQQKNTICQKNIYKKKIIISVYLAHYIQDA